MGQKKGNDTVLIIVRFWILCHFLSHEYPWKEILWAHGLNKCRSFHGNITQMGMSYIPEVYKSQVPGCLGNKILYHGIWCLWTLSVSTLLAPWIWRWHLRCFENWHNLTYPFIITTIVAVVSDGFTLCVSYIANTFLITDSSITFTQNSKGGLSQERFEHREATWTAW